MSIFVESVMSTDAGAAYLFDATTGAQLKKLTPNDPAASDYFGYSVALNSSTALIGAVYKANGTMTQAGAAYLFDASGTCLAIRSLRIAQNGGAKSPTRPRERAKSSGDVRHVLLSNKKGETCPHRRLFSKFKNPNFKNFKLPRLLPRLLPLPPSQRVLKNYEIRSAWKVLLRAFTNFLKMSIFVDSLMSTATGAAYLFDATTGAQLKKLTPNDPAASDWFGYSVALNSSTALIGAVYKANGTMTQAGAAYLFDATTGAQLKKLTPNDPAASDQFGVSVALNSSTALIGANLKANGSSTQAGAAYLFFQKFKILNF